MSNGLKLGIIGNGADKFTPIGEKRAKIKIYELISIPGKVTVVSGHSPLGGIDIWAEEIAREIGLRTEIFIPEIHSWNGGYGYKLRNLDIARTSDFVHVIVARNYPVNYTGRRFNICYHCGNTQLYHVKSGACWTAKEAMKLGKDAKWWFINND